MDRPWRTRAWSAVLVLCSAWLVVGASGPAVANEGASTQALANPATGMFIDGELGATVAGGHSYAFTAVTAGHVGAAVTFSSTQNGQTFNLTLAPMDGQALTVGSFPNAQLTADSSHPGIDLANGSGACTTATGMFLVDDVSLDGTGTPLTFSARFEFHCNGEDPAVWGAVSYKSTADYRTTTIPAAVDFGIVNLGETKTVPFTVTNNGPADLTVDDLGLSGPGAMAGFFWMGPGPATTCGGTLHTGQSCTVYVSFQPQTGWGPGTFSAFFSIGDENTLPGWGRSRRVTLTATIAAPVSQSLGGYVTADPSAVIDPENAHGEYVFVRGGDLALYVKHSTDGATWSPYQSEGGFLSSLPFAVSDPAGTSGTVGAYVFARGGDGGLYVGRIVNGTWQGWQSLGGYLSSFPTATVAPDGIWVGVRGGDGALYTRHLANNTWSGWQAWGGYLSAAPFLAPNGSDVYAFVPGGDLGLYSRNVKTGSPWQGLGGALSSPALAVSDGSGIWVLVRGLDGAAYSRHLTGNTWGPFVGFGGYLSSAPWPVTNGSGVTVFVRGADGALYRNHNDGPGWDGWSSPSQVKFDSDAVGVIDGDAIEHVFMVGTNGALNTVIVNAISHLSISALGAGMNMGGAQVPAFLQNSLEHIVPAA